MSPNEKSAELERMSRHYNARHQIVPETQYDPFRPYVFMSVQERERALIRILGEKLPCPPLKAEVVEVGCGDGAELLRLMQLGFSPDRLTGLEVLEESFVRARSRLPAAVRLIRCDATDVPELGGQSFDVVYQSTVFSSILSNALQQELAARMWQWVRPGGGVLWYDFVYDNPRNREVRGVPRRRIQELFPKAPILYRRITLAPPLGRFFCRRSPKFYPLLNAFGILRTHILAWIGKPDSVIAAVGPSQGGYALHA